MKYYFNILDLFPYFILFTLICFIINNKKRNLFYLVIVVIVFLFQLFCRGSREFRCVSLW